MVQLTKCFFGIELLVLVREVEEKRAKALQKSIKRKEVTNKFC